MLARNAAIFALGMEGRMSIRSRTGESQSAWRSTKSMVALLLICACAACEKPEMRCNRAKLTAHDAWLAYASVIKMKADALHHEQNILEEQYDFDLLLAEQHRRTAAPKTVRDRYDQLDHQARPFDYMLVRVRTVVGNSTGKALNAHETVEQLRREMDAARSKPSSAVGKVDDATLTIAFAASGDSWSACKEVDL